MKNPIRLAVLLLVLSMVVSACGGTPAAPTASPAGALSEDYENAISVRNQLLLGTLRLQGTAEALTADQAKSLLPLWQAVQALTGSETTAEEETDAVLNQIEAALTPAQVRAIAALQLTNEHLTAWYSEMGVVLPTPQPGVTPMSGSGKNSGLTTEQREATKAAAAAAGTPVAVGTGGGSARNTLLLDTVIQTLEALAS